jgi:hypothetical protein
MGFLSKSALAIVVSGERENQKERTKTGFARS